MSETERCHWNGEDREGVQITKLDEFKYLESTVQSNEDCGREVKKCGMGGNVSMCKEKVSARLNRMSKQWLDQHCCLVQSQRD